MSVSRSEQFVYLQSKATHYNQLRNIKSTIDDRAPWGVIRKPKVYRPLPLLQQHQIDVENQHLIQRLIHVSLSPRRQVAVEGGYSRYHKVQRPFRQQKPLKAETDRSITIDNFQLRHRVERARPAIGSKAEWSREYSKSLNCRRNLSKYLHSNKSKGELHISTDRFLPQHLRDYAIDPNLNSPVSGQEATVSMEKLFALPHLNRKNRSRNWHFQQLSKSIQETDL